MNRKLVNFQVFPDLAHQAELEIHQGQIRLDRNFPFHGTHVRLTYDLHDKHWIPYIGINDPSNCKADTKNKGYKKLLKTFTAHRANDYSIEYYDHKSSSLPETLSLPSTPSKSQVSPTLFPFNFPNNPDARY